MPACRAAEGESTAITMSVLMPTRQQPYQQNVPVVKKS